MKMMISVLFCISRIISCWLWLLVTLAAFYNIFTVNFYHLIQNH